MYKRQTLNRPDILNAIGAEMTRDLIVTLRIADGEPSTGCIVLTGSGRAFCSGGDVSSMGEGPPLDRVLHRDWHLLNAVLGTEKPIIAMVNGAAVGLGATIALSLIHICGTPRDSGALPRDTFGEADCGAGMIRGRT